MIVQYCSNTSKIFQHGTILKVYKYSYHQFNAEIRHFKATLYLNYEPTAACHRWLQFCREMGKFLSLICCSPLQICYDLVHTSCSNCCKRLGHCAYFENFLFLLQQTTPVARWRRFAASLNKPLIVLSVHITTGATSASSLGMPHTRWSHSTDKEWTV